MRENLPSRTAQFVAFNRALGHLSPVVPGFADPVAEALVPPRFHRWVQNGKRAVARGKSPYPFWTRGMGYCHQFRTVVLDQAVAAVAPVAQLVVLGAGLDARAWRLPELGDATVFEVDHLATQTWKREHVAALPPRAREVRFVTMDFLHDDLAAKLTEAGLDRETPTFWLWEGVTMYLPSKSVAATLSAMAQLSRAGSGAAVTYMARKNGRMPTSPFLALMGEPVQSAFDPPEFAELARAAGWETAGDSGIRDWLSERTPSLRLRPRQVGLQWNERVWVGRRTA